MHAFVCPLLWFQELMLPNNASHRSLELQKALKGFNNLAFGIIDAKLQLSLARSSVLKSVTASKMWRVYPGGLMQSSCQRISWDLVQGPFSYGALAHGFCTCLVAGAGIYKSSHRISFRDLYGSRWIQGSYVHVFICIQLLLRAPSWGSCLWMTHRKCYARLDDGQGWMWVDVHRFLTM